MALSEHFDSLPYHNLLHTTAEKVKSKMVQLAIRKHPGLWSDCVKTFKLSQPGINSLIFPQES